MISITVIGVYFDMISPIATFVLIPINDRDSSYHLFTPVIGKDLGLVVKASEHSHTLKVCYYHFTILCSELW